MKTLRNKISGNIKFKVLLLVIIFILIFVFIITSGLATSGKTHRPLAQEGHPSCGMENCHGLNISCGPKVPEFCTEIYELGDFCREFVRCEIVQGESAG
jgi:hypothetical protein